MTRLAPPQPRDRYSVTNMTDIHLYRFCRSRNSDRSGRLAVACRAARRVARQATRARSRGRPGVSPASNRTDRKTYLGMRLIPLARTPDGNSRARVRQRTSNGTLMAGQGHSLSQKITSRHDLCPKPVASRHSLLGSSRDKLRHLGKEAHRYGWQGA